jgi:hypothetical protein
VYFFDSFLFNIFTLYTNTKHMKKILLSIAVVAAAYQVNAQTQPPNAGMETWASTFGEPQEPTGWVTANAFASPLISASNPTSATQYTPSYAGTYAAKIATVKLTTNPAYPAVADTIGVLVLGSVKTTAPYLLSGIPYIQKPISLSFESMYTPVGGDAASAVVELTKWNTATTPASRIVIAKSAAIIAPSATYMANSITLTYLDQVTIPDTLQIIFSASSSRAGARPGSALVIDAVALSGINGIQEYKNTVQFSTYPNPAASELNLVTDSKKVDAISIMDITGKQIELVKITADRTQLNTAEYVSGIYIYAASNNKGEIVARGKFNVVK